jgi:prevent-host-death family protein
MQYGLAQAKARLSELTSLVDAGQDVVLTKHGRPSYRLIALSNSTSFDQHDAPSNPSGLDDVAAFFAETRSKTLGVWRKNKAVKSDKNEPSFVPQWRQTERY